MSLWHFYNDNDPYVCQWTRNLMYKGLIPKGDVVCSRIEDLDSADLEDYVSCHFFCGIAGWSYALRLAGWPDEKPVWTGSCPCQPFSVAGKQLGFEDARHLWPDFAYLIAERRPPVVFGEQVANASQWLAGVRGDLESLGYAVGAIPIEAACAGAAQLRDRIWFVACQPRFSQREPEHTVSSKSWNQTWSNGGRARARYDSERPPSLGWGEGWTESEFRGRGFAATVASLPDGTQFIECPDGKFRRLPPPRVRWLGNGIPSRVARLRALGNSIYPQVAAEFIRAYMECRP